jgi:hypothetical protein
MITKRTITTPRAHELKNAGTFVEHDTVTSWEFSPLGIVFLAFVGLFCYFIGRLH